MDISQNLAANTVHVSTSSVGRGEQVGGLRSPRPGDARGPQGSAFADVLEKARAKAAPESEINFSRHASERLRDRGIELSNNDVTKISEGLDRAKAKGARDSLLLYGNLGLIVNVPSRTIVTAVDENSMTEKVFTNIDSTVIVPR